MATWHTTSRRVAAVNMLQPDDKPMPQHRMCIGYQHESTVPCRSPKQLMSASCLLLLAKLHVKTEHMPECRVHLS